MNVAGGARDQIRRSVAIELLQLGLRGHVNPSRQTITQSAERNSLMGGKLLDQFRELCEAGQANALSAAVRLPWRFRLTAKLKW